ncbi:hypothetical protein [Kiloniella majae]|uniref:hypothetical protein n=1 Tax=Kiloniella majae TaxID=1938558 RepID=UPI000F7B8C53|nr:hypothetical protein [Kiloniella majae]
MSHMTDLWAAYRKHEDKADTYGKEDVPDSWFTEARKIELGITENTPQTAEDVVVKLKLLREYVKFSCGDTEEKLIDCVISSLQKEIPMTSASKHKVIGTY